MREVLEGMSARLAADNMPKQAIQEPFSLLDEHDNDIRQEQDKYYFKNEVDLDFHYKIASARNNSWLIELLTSDLYQLLRMCRRRSCQMPDCARKALDEHRQIALSIKSHDPELSEILMRRHIISAWKKVNQFLLKERQVELSTTPKLTSNKVNK